MADVGRAQREVHAALQHFLGDNEVPIAWTLTIDVAGMGGGRYLAHRAGGGLDGQEAPMTWVALGMRQAAADDARDQMRGITVDADSDEGDADGR